MKILWTSAQEGYLGGGSCSERTLLRYLNRSGYQVDHVIATKLIGSGLARGPWEFRQKVIGKIMKFYLRNRIRRIHYDVIVSQGVWYPQVGELANKYGIPHLVFIRDQFYRCPRALHRPCKGSCFHCVSTGQKVIWPLVRNLINQKKKGIKNADMVLTNSIHMKNDIEKYVDKTVNVLFPPVEFPDRFGKKDGSHDKIIYMGCGPWKGTSLVMDMAKMMTQYDFLVAGERTLDLRYDLSDYPNVEWYPWIDRQTAFDQARVHLFPSFWPEPFGRIPVEAGNRGIPTVGSDRGGVPEAIGDGGILLDPYKIHDWVRVTRTMMECDQLHDDLGIKARDHSVKFGVSRIVPQFEGYLSQLGG